VKGERVVSLTVIHDNDGKIIFKREGKPFGEFKNNGVCVCDGERVSWVRDNDDADEKDTWDDGTDLAESWVDKLLLSTEENVFLFEDGDV
jgi:hypothetical protein